MNDRKPSSDGKRLNEQPELDLQLFESDTKTLHIPTDDSSKKRRTINEEENRNKKKKKKRRNDLIRQDSNPQLPQQPPQKQQQQQTELDKSSEKSSLISHDLCGRPVLKVPPLKIILSNSNNVIGPNHSEDNVTCNSTFQNTSNYFQEEKETASTGGDENRKGEFLLFFSLRNFFLCPDRKRHMSPGALLFD